jgi:HSP20 family protein
MLDIFDPFKMSEFQHDVDSIDEKGIKIELPGVKSSNLDVSVQGRTLKVTGKSRHGKEFSYVYSLKSSVDESAITAKFEDGLLDITLPKKSSETTVRKIVIET